MFIPMMETIGFGGFVQGGYVHFGGVIRGREGGLRQMRLTKWKRKDGYVEGWVEV